MDENAFREWLVSCFGEVQGQAAWEQINRMPDAIRDQLMSQDPSTLPDPEQVKQMMAAFTAGGLNTMGDMQRTVEEGPINVKLAKSLALQGAANGEQTTVSAAEAAAFRSALSEANLWLDSACAFDPAPGEAKVLTRSAWVEETLDAWAGFAAPVAGSMSEALASVLSERLGGSFGDSAEITGLFAGPVPIPIPDGMKDPGQLMRLLGNTSFAMQLGQAAGALSHEVRGSFDQGIALLDTPAGGLIAQNVSEYAKSLDIDEGEVTAFLALIEEAHARLFASVPWLMPRFEALIGKYARGISIDLDAMEEQMRDAEGMDPESISDAVNLTKVAIPNSDEQNEAMASLETLLALVEGWVDCVAWRAGMAHLPHIEQLREMRRRERAVGGPAERTFESLLGLELRPKRMREAAALWESIGAAEGPDARDAKWGHPDLLPALPKDDTDETGANADEAGEAGTSHAGATADDAASDASTAKAGDTTIDWDSELSKLLDEDGGEFGDDAPDPDDPDKPDADGSASNGSVPNGPDSSGTGPGNDSDAS